MDLASYLGPFTRMVHAKTVRVKGLGCLRLGWILNFTKGVSKILMNEDIQKQPNVKGQYPKSS